MTTLVLPKWLEDNRKAGNSCPECRSANTVISNVFAFHKGSFRLARVCLNCCHSFFPIKFANLKEEQAHYNTHKDFPS